jgi:Flp pilus assembly protein TadD
MLLYKIAVCVFSETRATTPSWIRPGEVSGAIAATGWVFFVPAQAYALVLMPTTWFVFVFWFIVWRVVAGEAVLRRTAALLYGVLIGLTATGVATILFLVPILLAAIWLRARGRHSGTRRPLVACAAATVLLFAGIGIGTAPCWFHNYFIARDPVFLSAHGGVNFWIGNNPEANGYPRFRGGMRAEQASMLHDSTALAEAATGRTLRRSEVSAYWNNQAWTYIKGHPVNWMGLMWRKALNFWSAFQYDDVGVIDVLRQPGIITPGPHFGIVAALGIPGALIAVRRNRRARWVLAAILLQVAAVLTVFVTERYRMVVVPGLLLFVGYGSWRLCHWLIADHKAPAVVYVGSTVVAAVIISTPPKDFALWALDPYNTGRQALESGNLRLAENRLQLAHGYVPDNAETNFALGNVRLARNDPAGARAYYNATLSADPAHKGALNNLGIIALDENQPRLAVRFFRAAVNQEPLSAKTHYLLAKAHAAAGALENARSEITRAIELEPSQREFRLLEAELRRKAP